MSAGSDPVSVVVAALGGRRPVEWAGGAAVPVEVLAAVVAEVDDPAVSAAWRRLDAWEIVLVGFEVAGVWGSS